MTRQAPPAPKFARFERVVIRHREEALGLDPRRRRYEGLEGVVIWQDPHHTTSRRAFRQWVYVVSVPSLRRYPSVAEADLHSLGQFDPPGSHLGRGYEFSFDTVVDDRVDDYRTIEGCFRTPGAFWRVMCFSKADGPSTSSWHHGVWSSGIEGVTFDVAEDERLDRAYVRRALSLAIEAGDWVEVTGPDSLTMK